MLPRMTQTLEPPPPTQNVESPIVRASGLRKTFRMGDATVEVLKGVDLDVRPGEFLAIEGRSGSGKSTLLHLLAGLDTPDEGIIELGGEDVAALSRKVEQRESRMKRTVRSGSTAGAAFSTVGLVLASPISELFTYGTILAGSKAERRLARIRNESFGFVFQFYHLLPELNVLENTLLAAMVRYSWAGFRSNRRELRGRATDLLGRLGLGHRLTHRPNQLSGGERQRVAIARALMNDPPVLLADEPTGNLDFDTGREIMAVLEALHRDHGQTVVMVTHDRSLARTADRSMVLVEGRLVE